MLVNVNQSKSWKMLAYCGFFSLLFLCDALELTPAWSCRSVRVEFAQASLLMPTQTNAWPVNTKFFSNASQDQHHDSASKVLTYCFKPLSFGVAYCTEFMVAQITCEIVICVLVVFQNIVQIHAPSHDQKSVIEDWIFLKNGRYTQ